jgi:UDP-glucose:(heptosyl)LPS alpha-1,3-glucosyltransferase
VTSVRIALVYRSFDLSSSLARFSVELARYLSQRHDVHVYSIAERTDATIVPAVTFHPVPVRAVGHGGGYCARELVSFGRNAAALLRRERFDVIHARAPSTWHADVLHLPGIARGEAARAGYPAWRLAASRVRHPGHAARLLVERRSLSNPALRRIHVDAPSVRDDLVHYCGFAAEDILVALPGVDLDDFRPAPDRVAARRAAGIEGDRLAILFCGHEFRRKGLERAIEALAAARMDAELIVVGSSPDEPTFREIARRRGVGARVRFVGTTREPAVFFRAADVFVLPTHFDIWGATVVEAMAAGVPPVVSSAAGASSLIEEGRTGLVLREPFGFHELRDALERLAGDSRLRLGMGEAGRRQADAFSWEAHGKLVEADLIATVAERAQPIRRYARARSPRR